MKSKMSAKKKALIVFAKAPELGKVKTRLAKTIGPQNTLDIYERLLRKTETETLKLDDTDLYIYYSNFIDENYWPSQKHVIQATGDLGERMKSAFNDVFNLGYNTAVGIGSDLPDISCKIINTAFENLNLSDLTFGPANDGGYYLVGMNAFTPFIFENKSWSTDQLMIETKLELKAKKKSVLFLETLNDIDTEEDLISSGF